VAPYATVGDVRSLNTARTFSATSRPDIADVVNYLTETAAVLDGILSARNYALPVPITATTALELLSYYNAIGAWCLSEQAAESSPHRDAAAKAWENAQRMLRDGLIEPVGLTRDTTTGRARAAGVPTAWFRRDMEL
jgi:hypothetical protein